MRIIEVILAKGHPNITAKHPTTFEITKDHEITEKADCVVAIKASKGANDLNPKFKTLAQKQSARITAIFEAKGLKEIVKGFGHPKLS
ncbi:MAG: DUF371 domain-containing protein, partial [Euryarchaeota archaeon]|nr:DUF371 domain-containing protein [Euryarchaeota archaeon]